MTTKQPPLFVYVAGPLNSSGRFGDNVRHAAQVARKLIQGGAVPFVPHVMHGFMDVIETGTEEMWLRLDREWLLRCDAMIRIVGPSAGADMEEAWATEAGIPIYRHHVSKPYQYDGVWQLLSEWEVGKLRPRNREPQVIHSRGGYRMLRQLQAEQKEWAQRNFGTQRPSYHALLGMGEELGELQHAHLKNEQGIRGTPAEHRAKKIDALGDLWIYGMDYANLEEIDLEEAIRTTWDKVKQRDWTKNKANGGDLDAPSATQIGGLAHEWDDGKLPVCRVCRQGPRESAFCPGPPPVVEGRDCG